LKAEKSQANPDNLFSHAIWLFISSARKQEKKNLLRMEILGDDDLKTVQQVFSRIFCVSAVPFSENTNSHYHLPTIAAEKTAQESQT
jgi:hypothetical protein